MKSLTKKQEVIARLHSRVCTETILSSRLDDTEGLACGSTLIVQDDPLQGCTRPVLYCPAHGRFIDWSQSKAASA